MPWFKVDDHLAMHPKVLEASNAAMGLWVRAGSWCAANLTDGSLPAAMVAPLGGRPRDATRLVECGLWERVDGGYRFKGWEDYQPTKTEVEAERRANRDRQKEYRERRRNGASNGVSNGVTPPVSNAAPTRPDPTHKETPVVPTVDGAPADKPKTSGRKRPTKQLPDDWTPKDHHVSKARELGVDGRREEEKFRAHAGATDRRQVDWDKAFTAWLLNAKPMGNVRPLPTANADGPPKPKPREIDPDAPFQPQPRRFGEENRLR